MTLQRSNKVTNVGRIKFTELVLDLLQLLTLEELHYAIPRIIKQVICQEGHVGTEGNRKDFCIRCAIHLLCDQPSSLLNKLPTHRTPKLCAWGHRERPVTRFLYLTSKFQCRKLEAEQKQFVHPFMELPSFGLRAP